MITKCKECGNDVSTEAISCPSCGYPLKQQTTPVLPANNKKNHIYGWIALIAFFLSNITPAILAPIIVLVAIIFSLLEISGGNKVFGGIVLALSLVQIYFIADHFSGVSGTLGLTNPKEIEQKMAEKYSNSNPINLNDAELIIDQKCSEKWPGDYSMINHCKKSQYEGLQKIEKQIPSDVNTDASIIIRGKCANEWPRDFQMRAHCESKQIEAYRILAGATDASCAQQWPDDYSMQKYCMLKN